MPELTRFSADRVASLLADLASRLNAQGSTVSIIVVGGAAISLSVRPQRDATIDVDVFANMTEPLKRVILDIAYDEDLPADWLNAKAQQFMSPVASHSDLPVQVQVGDVTIHRLDETSLLAMKLRAGRIGKDLDDIKALILSLNVTSMDQAQAILDGYYQGEEQMKPASRQLLEKLFDDT